MGPPAVADMAAQAMPFRADLHRYAARLVGSVIDGEDIVQDAMLRAVAAPELADLRSLRAWLFRVVHNRAMDVLRARAIRSAEPIEVAVDLADDCTLGPEEVLLTRESVGTAVARFARLPVTQRCVIVLKDVLGETLADIADLLDLSVDAVKAHLARGRERLARINAEAPAGPPPSPASASAARFAALFNAQDWDALRTMLADDVRLRQSEHPERRGRADVGMFFGIYARTPGLRLAPAWVEGREVIAVFEPPDAPAPRYFMWLDWQGNRIAFIRDYRHVPYVAEGAGLALAPS
jgi:RNA polymerase sigma-70 factor (ECF subfamily)